MKGDFSQWKFDPNQNFSGVLHQQGRVLLDSDWNAQTQITSDWQDTAAREAFGPGVAAVPAGDRDAFKVTKASIDGTQVKVTLQPGRVWADGMLVHLTGETILDASYLGPPIQDPPVTPNGATTRDAVILEVWRETVNGFQVPDDLIEPALGGPDTTERMHTAMALKLYRLGPGETCENIRHKLQDDSSQRGRLRVSFQETTTTEGDCPVAESGGYTGFEHHLYRIEIAQVNEGDPPMFKWSRFNGGIVGRGIFHPESGSETAKVKITTNLAAIQYSGFKELVEPLYLEALKYDETLGHWQVIYGSQVTLSDDNELVLTPTDGAGILGNFPNSTESVFFRLWDGIKAINDFVVAITGPHDFHNGIQLEFGNPEGNIYRPGDYWTFSVRAGGIGYSETLSSWELPEGVDYHRVPLAELTWGEGNEAEIEDCRRLLRPLTNQKVCCSYTVGDGFSSQGDYNSIEEAVDKLPPWGGEICLLPGFHRASVKFEGKFNLKIKGCGLRTLVYNQSTEPIFKLVNSWHITLENMALGKPMGPAIQVEGGGQVDIGHNYFLAFKHAINVRQSMNINIHHNQIYMVNRANGDVAIFLDAEDSLLERNLVAVLPKGVPPQSSGGEESDIDNLYDLCGQLLGVRIQTIDHELRSAVINRQRLFTTQPYLAHGGIQIASGCDRVRVLENRILGGWSNGITLGSYLDPDDFSSDRVNEGRNHELANTRDEIFGIVIFENLPLSGVSISFHNKDDDEQILTTNTDNVGIFLIQNAKVRDYIVSINHPDYAIDSIVPREETAEFVFHQINVVQVEEKIDLSDTLAFITEVTIERNEISHMGLSGIGTPQLNLLALSLLKNSYPVRHTLATYFGVLSGFIFDLTIYRNHIHNCLQNIFNPGNQSDFSNSMRELVKLRGEGGISLGICENLSICENTIEENGKNHLEPVCGVFISYVGQADIRDNKVSNNGSLDANVGIILQPGIRGGVILRLATAVTSLTERLQFTSKDNNPLKAAFGLLEDIGGHAIHIQDNVVRQPVGQALRASVLGPVSVSNNRFNTDVSNYANMQIPALWQVEKRAGTIFVVNLGGFATESSNMTVPVAVQAPAIFPNGNILFSNNQTRLGLDLVSITSQIIATRDDLGFHNNHSEVLAAPAKDVFKINTMLLAPTLRATNNRFRELFA
jgi:hypothetical protein